MSNSRIRLIPLVLAVLCLGLPTALWAQNCQYVQGETKYEDWAKCRYGDEAVVLVPVPDIASWDQCIYLAEPFRPEQLLAVTRQEADGKESVSVNDRSQVGNPCYLTKGRCDKALKALKDSGAY